MWLVQPVEQQINLVLPKYTKNHDHMLYCSWDTASDWCNFYFSFWAIFCPFTPLTTEKPRFYKNEQNTWRHHHFTHVYQKLWSHDVWFLRYDVRQMERQTDRQACIRKEALGTRLILTKTMERKYVSALLRLDLVI